MTLTQQPHIDNLVDAIELTTPATQPPSSTAAVNAIAASRTSHDAESATKAVETANADAPNTGDGDTGEERAKQRSAWRTATIMIALFVGVPLSFSSSYYPIYTASCTTNKER